LNYIKILKILRLKKLAGKGRRELGRLGEGEIMTYLKTLRFLRYNGEPGEGGRGEKERELLSIYRPY